MVDLLSAICFIAIDVNVFGHLINKEKNVCKHIHEVLNVLQSKGVGLLVDGKGLIAGEYRRHLGNEHFMKNPEYANEAYILTYWLLPDIRKEIDMDCSDDLAKDIKAVIGDKERVDRAFIYVAAKEESFLISNDKKHIINNREELYKELSNKIQIFSSWDMFKKLNK